MVENSKRNVIWSIVATALLVGILYLFFTQSPGQKPLPSSTIRPTVASSSTVLGVQTKTSGCVAHDGLPDRDCTPGAIIATATIEQICVPGYSRSVRNVPLEEKNQVYQEYTITHHAQGEYEVDHLISLELGGSNDIANLWPEAADPRPGFHEKDQLENYLHDQVCSGSISLQEAQKKISTNWLGIYNQIK